MALANLPLAIDDASGSLRRVWNASVPLDRLPSLASEYVALVEAWPRNTSFRDRKNELIAPLSVIIDEIDRSISGPPPRADDALVLPLYVITEALNFSIEDVSGRLISPTWTNRTFSTVRWTMLYSIASLSGAISTEIEEYSHPVHDPPLARIPIESLHITYNPEAFADRVAYGEYIQQVEIQVNYWLGIWWQEAKNALAERSGRPIIRI
jgi:hypothetical protein